MGGDGRLGAVVGPAVLAILLGAGLGVRFMSLEETSGLDAARPVSEAVSGE